MSPKTSPKRPRRRRTASKPKKQLPPLTVTRHALEASLCADSFYDFVRAMWHEVISAKPVWNWHIEYLCEELQFAAERVFEGRPKLYDLIINIPPGSTKSTICSTMFPAWTWTRMPTAQHICVSYEKGLALNLGRDCRDIVTSDKYRTLFPHVRLREDQNAKSDFKNTSGGWRFACGVEGNVTGRHAHFQILDDLINPLAADQMSGLELEKVNDWTNNTIANRKVDSLVSLQILIMQRLHQNDPTGNRLARKEEEGPVKHICLPADDDYPIKPERLKKVYRQNDGLLDPVRLGPTALARYKAKGSYFYAGQYGQQPIPKKGGLVKLDRLLLESAPLDYSKYVKLVRYWDKAGTDSGGDYTVGVLMGLDHKKRYWILDVRRGQWGIDEREDIIKSTAITDGKRVEIGLEIEGGSAGKADAQSTIRNLHGYTVTAEHPTGNKEMRARPFFAKINQGEVRMVRGDWNYAYIDELRYFPRGNHDDQVDASSGAFNLIHTIPTVGMM